MTTPNVIHISTMTGKLKDIDAINTNTLSNQFCAAMQEMVLEDVICTDCYSYRMLSTYRKTCTDAFEHNSQLLQNPVHWDDLPRIHTLRLRINAHGELINMNHMVNIHNIASKNPDTVVALWTKRKDIIRKYHQQYTQPDNLILVFSNPIKDNVMPNAPEGFNKVFNNVTGADARANCTGQKCADCLMCYTPDNDTECIVEHVK